MGDLPESAEAEMAERAAAEQRENAALRDKSALPPLENFGKIIIEWPPEPAPVIPGWRLKVEDAETGKPILTVLSLVIHAHAKGLVWAELTMFAGHDGKPLYGGEKFAPGDLPVKDGEIITGTFPFRVQAMRVRGDG